ncbi:hypothetical protein AB3X52_05410 [Nocardioides sp. DS6]|uniref:DUF2336 domain-containing protein n=1 Tax=Nocardioides eburneus TaxID=3231482 RepID=A0ABV3SVU3_9ACTN
MGDLASRLEVAKLARQLGVDQGGLAFLTDRSPAELKDLRTVAAHALFSRNEDRVTRLAALSRMLPVPITAKIAEHALGPMLSARVAAVLDPREAARLAGRLDPDFLARLAVSLDPGRVAPIVRGLPDDLVVGVGRRLLRAGEHLTLGRFVSVVSVDVALAVVEGASGHDLLQVALFTDEPSSLEAIVRRLPDDLLGEIIRAADADGAYDAAVGLLLSLSPESCARLVAQVGIVSAGAREAIVEAVAEHDVWPAVLPALHVVDAPVLAALVNVPSTLDVAAVDRVVEHARELDLAPVLVQLVLGFDDDHLDVLRESDRLRDPALQEWLITHAGVSGRLVIPVLESLGLR